MVSSNLRPIHRKHDGPGVFVTPGPEQHWYPQNLQEILEVVGMAQLEPQRPEVRALGAGWALSEAAVTNRWVVDIPNISNPLDGGMLMPALSNTLDNVIPSCLSAEALHALTTQPDTSSDLDHFHPESFNYYHVEAGIRVCELYSRLDQASTPPVPHSTHSLEARFPALSGSWALPAQGNAAGQTIVGAFSTGTHGQRVDSPPIADAVMALHLVAQGPQPAPGTTPAPESVPRQYWVERSVTPGQMPPLIDGAALARVFPGIQIIQNTQFFNALIVSAGRFGIIYSVVLRVVRQFAVSEHRLRTTWTAAQPFLLDSTSDVLGHRFVQVVVCPNASSDGHHACFVSTAEPVALNTIPPRGGVAMPGRAERTGANMCMAAPAGSSAGDIYSIVCGLPDARTVVQPVIDFVRGVALLALFTGNLLAFGVLISLAEGIQGRLDSISPTATLGDFLASLVNFLVSSRAASLLGPLNENLLASGLSPRAFIDISYAVLDTFDYRDRNCLTRADSMEVMFEGEPARSTAFIDFVETLFRRVGALENGTLILPDGSTIDRPRAFAGYVSLRFCGRTEALIGMQRWSPTCNIEISAPGGIDGSASLMSVLEADAIALGGTVHWGQRNTLRVAQVESVFPGISAWRDALANITENGRLDIFSTQFTRDRGLEVVQPLVAGFSVAPQFYCAGEHLRASWTADRNPPGTVVSLRIDGPGLRVNQVLPRLASDPGSPPADTGVALPVGVFTVRVVASFTFAGVTREGPSAPVSVTAFNRTSPPHPITGPVGRRTIDGADAWYVEVNLPADLWSSSLFAGNLFVPPGFPPVTVRKAGSTDMALRSGFEIGFAERTLMSGTWLLFSHSATRPASLGINVRVRCG